MHHSESVQEYSGPTNVKDNTEIDNLVERNDCDGESLCIIARTLHGHFVL
jgi:hypothetical protein